MVTLTPTERVGWLGFFCLRHGGCHKEVSEVKNIHFSVRSELGKQAAEIATLMLFPSKHGHTSGRCCMRDRSCLPCAFDCAFACSCHNVPAEESSFAYGDAQVSVADFASFKSPLGQTALILEGTSETLANIKLYVGTLGSVAWVLGSDTGGSASVPWVRLQPPRPKRSRIQKRPRWGDLPVPCFHTMQHETGAI